MGRHPYLGWQQQEGSREKAQARACLGLFGLEKMAARPVTELSGGQRQRVLLARILIQQTPVVLLDEPTAELDLVYENTVLGLSRQLARAGRSVSCPSTISVRLPGTVPGLFCWGREGCWPRVPPGRADGRKAGGGLWGTVPGAGTGGGTDGPGPAGSGPGSPGRKMAGADFGKQGGISE